jgi:hypothetical protein
MTEILEYRAPASTSDPDGKPLSIRRMAVSVALAILPAALWCLTHRYGGLIGDSELYAVQALSRTDPALARDVFLNSASQDRYTVFSPLYSLVIGLVGVRTAAISLLVMFKVLFYGAVFAFSRKIADPPLALLTTALLIVAPGEYGAYHVFRFSEDMLTARTLAEALAMTALCLQVYGRENAALWIAAVALCMHALIALPMVLLLLGLRVGIRANLLAGVFIVTAALAVAALAVFLPRWTPSFLSVMDSGWLEMVRERSQFVFLQLWRLDDWELNARPFLSLGLSMLVLCEDQRVRKLCVAASIVGVAGLLVAFIAGGVGPVALLLQGQAWRWVWVPELVSLLLLVPTVSRMWRSGGCGPVCAALLLTGWLFSVIDGVYLVAAAFCLWAGRKHVPASVEPYVRFLGAAIGLVAIAWIVFNVWTILKTPPPAATEPGALLAARRIMGVDCLPLLLVFLIWYWLGRARSVVAPVAIALALGTMTALAAPGALKDPRPEGTAAQIEEFSDWRRAIPPGENVFVVSKYYSAGFTWLTLQRPSYLTVDQSAGIIFSRATADEIRRRAQVLLPLEEPDWRLMSRRASHGGAFDAKASPLTRERLVQICADPQLGYVAAKEDVGFGALRHRHPGAWYDWNLYDCRQVIAHKDLE